MIIPPVISKGTERLGKSFDRKAPTLSVNPTPVINTINPIQKSHFPVKL